LGTTVKLDVHAYFSLPCLIYDDNKYVAESQWVELRVTPVHIGVSRKSANDSPLETLNQIESLG